MGKRSPIVKNTRFFAAIIATHGVFSAKPSIWERLMINSEGCLEGRLGIVITTTDKALQR
jgi:hypothetical protein